jgi:N-glycosylase/DNA lyase
MSVAPDASTLQITLPLGRYKPRTVTISQRRSKAVVEMRGATPGPATQRSVEEQVRHVLRLDEDLSGFYELLADDPDLAWATKGAGRMVRSPTVFEEVVKTVCTTNCSWGATKKMVATVVAELGEPAAGAPPKGPEGRAFPTPEAMAAAPDRFYRDVMRAGYRGPYFRALARSVVDGDVDLEALAVADLDDEEVAQRLQTLPGVGPYAAAHIMMMIGRYSLLILDSWTRPKYAGLVGRKTVKDTTIVRRFKRYGPWAGLAFWLFLTDDWIEDP